MKERLLGKDKTLELLDATVRRVEADGCEAVLTGSDQVLTRYANNAVFQNGQIVDARVAFRVLVGGRVGTTFTNDLSTEGLQAAAQRAATIAKASRGKSDFPGFPGHGEDPPDTPAFVEHTAHLEAGEKAAELAKVFARGKKSGLVIAGAYHSGAREVGIVNSSGLARYFAQTAADTKVFALNGHTSGYSGAIDIDHQRLDFPKLAEVCIEKCLHQSKIDDIEPGAYDVILEPEAISELLEWLSAIGFTSKSFEEHMSFAYGRVGEQITGDAVTIYDDGFCEAGVGLPTPFDGEGVAKQKVTLLDHGVARGVVWDTRSGSRAGCASTGHAVLDDNSPDNTAAPSNLVFAPGTLSRADLLDRVERGLWITRLHYVNGYLEPKKALMTGLTRDGTFRIENGKITSGVRNLRFTDSVLEAFSRIDGISRDLKAVPTWWSQLGAYVAPAVLIRGLKFNGVQAE